MSSLLAGPSSINPWIEDACFHSLTKKRSSTAPQNRPRLAQVRAMRLSLDSTHPSLLVIHDGKTFVVAFVPTSPSPVPSRGCMVRISDWNVSLVQHCATNVQETLDSSQVDIVSGILNSNPRQICLSAKKIEVLGGHGMGIVGNPTPVHQSVEVRRALMNLETKGISLEQQLQLGGSSGKARLGNVQELFANDENRTMIETLLAVPKKGIGGSGKTSATIPSTNNQTNGTSSAGVVLGDVSGLLESLRKDSSETSFVSRMMNNPSASIRINTTHTNTTATERATTSTASRNNDKDGPVLGNVRQVLAAGNDNSMADALFAAASNTGTRTRQQEQQEAEEESTKPASVENQARQVEPYGIRERFESRASVVSLKGVSDMFRSLVARRNSSVEPEQTENEAEEAKEENITDTEGIVDDNEKEASTQTQDANETRESDSECESQVLGISDMLVSQTQEVPEDAVATQETSEGIGTEHVDEVQAEATSTVAVVGGAKLVAGSNVENVETAAMDDSDAFANRIPAAISRSRTTDTVDSELILQDAVVRERGTVAGSNVYCVETVNAVNEETEVETRAIQETSVRQNVDHETRIEKSSETESSKKHPLENDQDEEDAATTNFANESQYATQLETQPPLQVNNEDTANQANGNNNEEENVARLPVPKKAAKSTNSKRPKKKRRKGMLNLWKDIQRRKENNK